MEVKNFEEMRGKFLIHIYIHTIFIARGLFGLKIAIKAI